MEKILAIFSVIIIVGYWINFWLNKEKSSDCIIISYIIGDNIEDNVIYDFSYFEKRKIVFLIAYSKTSTEELNETYGEDKINTPLIFRKSKVVFKGKKLWKIYL